jgi:hypothetical protein
VEATAGQLGFALVTSIELNGLILCTDGITRADDRYERPERRTDYSLTWNFSQEL